MKINTCLLQVPLLGLLLVGSLFAQGSGVVVGVITDPSGAVAPGVEVTAVNVDTGVERQAVSDAEGRFQFPRLPVGNYQVVAQLEGFSTFASEIFKLDIDTSRRVNVQLQVGQVSETVEVSGSVLQVDTEGSTIKETIDVRRIEELPLNGRNPLQLQLLVPGTNTGPGVPNLSENQGVSVNGARGISNTYMLDGGDNNDPLSNSAAVVPNPDAVAEFTIMTNNYEAKYGRNAGAVVNTSTKAGTNEFHGTLFNFLRNDAMDARNFFALGIGKLRRNQFGGSVGGPIIKNRTFFFFSDQMLRERRGATFSGLTAPTAEQRTGDFSNALRKPVDPATRTRFPNDQIPTALIDPASINFLDLLIPLPNAPNNRHVFNRPQDTDGNQIIGRVDHVISDKHRLFGRYFLDRSTQAGVLSAQVPSLESQVEFETMNATVNHTYTPSASLMNSLQFTFGKSLVDRGPLPIGGGLGTNYQDLGVNVPRAAPDDQVEEYGLVAHFRGQVAGYWNLNQDNLVKIDRRTYQFKDDVSWIRGAHTFEFGGEIRNTSNDRVTANGVDIQYNFTGLFSDESLADLLIGRAANTLHGSLRINELRGNAFHLYMQDKWQLKQNLTLSLGLRYDPFIPYYDKAFSPSQITVFRPGVQSTLFPTAPLGLVYGGDLNGAIPKGGTSSDWRNLVPRFSLAWRPMAKTSIRMGYGMFYETPRYFTLSNFVNSPPFSRQVRGNDVKFSDPYAGGASGFPFPGAANLSQEELQNFQFRTPVGFGLSVQEDLKAGYNQQWNVNVQRELGDILFTAAYIGAKASKLPTNQEVNPAFFGPGATAGNIHSRRLYPNFQGVGSFNNVGFSTYNAVQLTANKRFSKGFTLLAHYTYAKTIDNASQDGGLPAQFSLDPSAAKGLADFHLAHRFVSSFLWELPSPSDNRVVNHILGGWQANGIYTAQSGSPFDVVSGRDIALCGCGTNRPNQVGDPFLDSDRTRSEKIQQFFNPAAFALPAAGNFGNVGRNIMTGPTFWNVDFALFKKIPIRETMRLEFRAEFFNFFNHANLGNPISNISAGARGQITSATDARVTQFALKFVF